jgi:hypothetical protein
MRRHSTALISLKKLALPQVFLGGESQCLAFSAASGTKHMVFAPAPEMFSDPVSLHAAWQAVGKKTHATGELVHLRFGGVRQSRILKGARNGAVIAEAEMAPPISSSRHPFASGRVLPAAVLRLFVYGTSSLRPASIGGAKLPAADLPKNYITADLEAAAGQIPARGRGFGGIDLVCLAEYEAGAWAAGQVGKPAAMPGSVQPMIILPWNMAHFGSIVPELLRRLATFHRPGAPFPAVVLMPFNDPGMSGMIGDLRKTIGKAAESPGEVLQTIFLVRVTHLRGLAWLKTLSRTVWVDGNDPESWWTMARFTAAGFDPVALPADEPIRIEADTPFGTLHFDTKIPALRMLPHLLASLQGTGRAG